MTDGHKHWAVTVSPRMLRFLQGVTVWRSRDMDAVDRSRFPYTGRTPDDIEPDENGYWRLSLLGFLHGLTGFCAKHRKVQP
jgi:hypothetical protein